MIMHFHEVQQLIENNDRDSLTDYYNKLYGKLNDLGKRIDRLSIYLFVIVLIYYSSLSTMNVSLLIGPLSLSDKSLIFKCVPLIFAYIMMQIFLLLRAKKEVNYLINRLTNSIYHLKLSRLDTANGFITGFSRFVLPFSVMTEITSLFPSSIKSELTAYLSLLPQFVLLMAPIYFEGTAIEFLINNFWDDISGKIATVASSLLLVMMSFVWIRTDKNFVVIKDYN